MQVQPAKFEKKEGDQYQQPKGGGGGKGAQGGGGGGGGSAANKKARKALLERQERLLGWGGFDDKLPAEKVRRAWLRALLEGSAHSRVLGVTVSPPSGLCARGGKTEERAAGAGIGAQVTVVLRGMFRPAELAAELGGATELEAEVQQEASTLGPVEKVRVARGAGAWSRRVGRAHLAASRR